MKNSLLICVLVGILGAAASALADDKAEATKAFQQGLRAYDVAENKHDKAMYEVANKAFAQAYALVPSDPHLWNLALSEVDTGRLMQGMAHLRLYDAHQHVLGQLGHPKLKTLSDYLARARAGLGHLQADGAAGSAVTLDGKPIGTMPLTDQDLEPGPHVVEWDGQRFDFDVAAGQTMKIKGREPPPPEPAPPAVMPAPARDPLADHASAVAEPPPTASHAARDVVRWSSTGVAVASAAVGFVLMADANGKAGSLTTFEAAHPAGCASLSSPACAQTQSMMSSYHTTVTVSQVALVVAGVSAVGAVAAWTLWPRGDVRVSPDVGPHQAGFGLGGSF